jgi:phage terminase small subunit
VAKDYALEPSDVKLLVLAAEAWDQGELARGALAEHGLTYTDRFGAPRARPEAAILRDSRIAFARLLRDLRLDVEAPRGGPGRPGLGNKPDY